MVKKMGEPGIEPNANRISGSGPEDAPERNRGWCPRAEPGVNDGIGTEHFHDLDFRAERPGAVKPQMLRTHADGGGRLLQQARKIFRREDLRTPDRSVSISMSGGKPLFLTCSFFGNVQPEQVRKRGLPPLVELAKSPV